ncbi:hypothetical protein [uncultured Nocardioides sp.]|uniref:hypothetical protein n=1 Tax=uncultured Nocardioides sp. TaxID=198441 RepID=UPI002622A950|nr:hypothetical protein [uncultured Nocardioides sp.]
MTSGEVFGEAWEALRSERAAARARLGELHRQLEEVEGRLRDLDAVITGFRRLSLAPGVEERSQQEAALEDASNEQDDEGDAREPGAPSSTSTPKKRRIRSTDLVATLVNQATEPMTRDQIVNAFEVHIGFPKSWANPRNAVGNALNRAAKAGRVQTLPGDTFAPREWRGDPPEGQADE